MEHLGVIILVICAYVVKGLVWVIFDVYVYKSKYDNVLSTVISCTFWPVIALIKTIGVIRQKLCQR
jgi:uncharacterized membrane-anchored protein